MCTYGFCAKWYWGWGLCLLIMLSSCLTFVLESLLQDNIRSCLDVEDDEIQSLMEMIFDSCFPESQVRSPCNLASTDRSPHPPTFFLPSSCVCDYLSFLWLQQEWRWECIQPYGFQLLNHWKLIHFNTGCCRDFSSTQQENGWNSTKIPFFAFSLLYLFKVLTHVTLHRLQLHLFSIHQNTSVPPKMSMHFHGVSSSETPVVDESVRFKILHNSLISWRWWWLSHTRFEPGSVSMFCLQMCQLPMCCSEWCTSMAQRQYLTLSSHYWSSCILYWQWKISQISSAPTRILQMIL